MHANEKKTPAVAVFLAVLPLILILRSGQSSARPCCPDDPENMTFDVLRERADYLIGNHVGETLDFPFNYIFKNARANVYSENGSFVIAVRSASGRLAGHSLYAYQRPAIMIYAEEPALDRIWHASDMPHRQ